MKVIIAGGRKFNDYELLSKTMDDLRQKVKVDEIVSGGANGTDRLGERYAKEHYIKCTVFKADWENKGKSAGILRNLTMGSYADGLVAFWNGSSRGTKHMIDTMEKKKKKHMVVSVNY